MDTRPASDAPDGVRQDALAALCAEVFLDPGRLVKGHVFPARRRDATPKRPAPPHVHERFLQLDFAVGCSGRWIVNGVAYPVQGDTLAAFYPGEWHTYDVRGDVPGARIYSVKLDIEPGWPGITGRAFAAHRSGVRQGEPLVRAWLRLIRAWGTPAVVPPAHIALRLCELLCLWPPSGVQTAGPHFAAQDSAVEAALHHIERHTDRLVPLTELAKVTHLSARHLSRRFSGACGVTPHEYAAGLRLRLAQDWLHEGTLSVSQVATALGFSSVQGFSRWFKARTGAPPRSWQGGRPPGDRNG